MLKIISAQRMIDPEFPEETESVSEDENLPIVTPENIGKYIEPEEDIDKENINYEPPVEETTTLNEIPIPYEDPSSLIDKAIKDQQSISFEYTNRFGKYSGWRLVDPYGRFTALGTGNNIITTWDKGKNAIRGFIVDNIHEMTLKIMPGKLYKFKKDKFVFQPK